MRRRTWRTLSTPTAAERLLVVLDTNVLVSGLNYYGGAPSRLLRLTLQGEMDFFSSPFILEELHRGLVRRFRWEEDRAQGALRLIREVATEVDPPRSVSVIQQKEDDNRILECALQANAQYLVSGDRRLLPRGLPLGRPRGRGTFLGECDGY